MNHRAKSNFLGIIKYKIPSGRIASLDHLKGFLIIFMMAAHLIAEYDIVPGWMKNSNRIGSVTLIDLGVAFFIFASGVTLGLAFDKSLSRDGKKKTIQRFVQRDLLLIAFGLIGVWLLKENLLKQWGVLETIGLAGLVALPFMFLSPPARFLIGILLILIFNAIGRLGYWDWLQTEPFGGMGGVLGSMAWGGIALMGSILSVPLRDNWRRFSIYSLLLGTIGVTFGLAFLDTEFMDKRLITITYAAFSAGIASWLVFLFQLINRRLNFAWQPLLIFGINSMTVFILHALLILGIIALIPSDSSVIGIIIALIIMYVFVFIPIWLLYRKRIFIRL